MKKLADMTCMQNIPDDAMLLLCCKVGESKLNPYSAIVLTNSSGTDYVVNEHEHFGQYDLIKILSEVMPFYNYPARLKGNPY